MNWKDVQIPCTFPKVNTDNYKEKAINGDISSTINPYLTTQNNFNWTYGTNNNITYTA